MRNCSQTEVLAWFCPCGGQKAQGLALRWNMSEGIRLQLFQSIFTSIASVLFSEWRWTVHPGGREAASFGLYQCLFREWSQQEKGQQDQETQADLQWR